MGFVLAMLIFPDVQKEAQAVLDRVCGPTRLPTMDDEGELQYIRACVKETLRWFPTDVLGIPHAVIQDDEYMGYRIPKGAGIIWNVWAVNKDPARYPKPQVFDPNRYASDFQTALEAATNAAVSQRDHLVFGAGRRRCQGMHIAERSLFLAISRLLWAFDIKPALDAEGNEMAVPEPEQIELTQGFLVQPMPFPVRITARSAAHAKVLREEWARCEAVLDDEMQWKVTPEGLSVPF
jgi:cytochrome P450